MVPHYTVLSYFVILLQHYVALVKSEFEFVKSESDAFP